MAPCVCNGVYQSIKRGLPRHRESNLTRCRKFVLLYVRVTSSARSRSCFFCMEHVRRVHPAGTAGAILPPYSTRIPMGMYLYTWYGAVAVGPVYSLSSGTRCAGLFTAGRRDSFATPSRESREAYEACNRLCTTFTPPPLFSCGTNQKRRSAHVGVRPPSSLHNNRTPPRRHARPSASTGRSGMAGLVHSRRTMSFRVHP